MTNNAFYAVLLSFSFIYVSVMLVTLSVIDNQSDIKDMKRVIIYQSEAIILMDHVLQDNERTQREIHLILEMEPPTIYIPNTEDGEWTPPFTIMNESI